MSVYEHAYDDGLERAALHLYRKAGKMRSPDQNALGATTANMMAMIFEAEAEEILALRKAHLP